MKAVLFRTIALSVVVLASLTTELAHAGDREPPKGEAVFFGPIEGGALMTIDGRAAEAMYRSMNRVKTDTIDLGHGEMVAVRYTEVQGVGCLHTRFKGEKPKYGCMLAFDRIATGEFSSFVEKLYGRRR